MIHAAFHHLTFGSKLIVAKARQEMGRDVKLDRECWLTPLSPYGPLNDTHWFHRRSSGVATAFRFVGNRGCWKSRINLWLGVRELIIGMRTGGPTGGWVAGGLLSANVEEPIEAILRLAVHQFHDGFPPPQPCVACVTYCVTIRS